jgi:hypothetical protein
VSRKKKSITFYGQVLTNFSFSKILITDFSSQTEDNEISPCYFRQEYLWIYCNQNL